MKLHPASVTLILAATVLSTAAARAQGFEEELDETRTEAWAMRWFAGVATPTSFGAPEAGEAWSWELGFEGGLIPSLSEEDRRVGFNGTKVEDINRSPVIGRPVIRLNLPAEFSFTAAWVPPVEIDGVTADIPSLAIARPFWTGERARLGGQLSWMDGEVSGDITCPADEAAAGEDPDANPFNCHEPSDDEMEFETWTFELAWSYAATDRLELFLSGLWQELDSEFEVHAFYSDFRDDTVLTFEGDQWAATAGLAFDASERWRLSGELYYSPLDVIRDPSGVGPKESDDLFTARAMVMYRFR